MKARVSHCKSSSAAAILTWFCVVLCARLQFVVLFNNASRLIGVLGVGVVVVGVQVCAYVCACMGRDFKTNQLTVFIIIFNTESRFSKSSDAVQ